MHVLLLNEQFCNDTGRIQRLQVKNKDEHDHFVNTVLIFPDGCAWKKSLCTLP
jgi:hypothetical protein